MSEPARSEAPGALSIGPVVLAGGALSTISVVLEILPILNESDLATPAGRLHAVTTPLPQVAPLLAAAVFLYVGSRASSRSWVRWAVAGYLIGLGVLCLAGIARLLPDVASLVSSVPSEQLVRFRTQAARGFVAMIVVGGVAAIGALTLLRSRLSASQT